MTTALERPAKQRHRTPIAHGHGPWLIAAGLFLGTLALFCSYTLAASQPDATAARYGLFWLGLFLGAAPLIGVAMNPDVTDRIRTIGLISVGLFTYLPKVMRSVAYPALYDEKLHFAQAAAMDASGDLFGVPNSVVPAISQYPGLHWLLVGGHNITGLSYYHVGLVLIAGAHVAAVLGIRALARRFGATEPVATLSGAMYALTPGFLFFNAMVAYQSLALPIAIWVVVGVLTLLDNRPGGKRTWVLAGATVAGIAAVGLTHHLTTVMLCIALVCLAAARALGRGTSRRDRALGLATLGAGAVAVVFQLAVAGESIGKTLKYLLPSGDMLTLPSLSSILGGGSGDGQSRAAFSGSVLPAYEQYAGYLAPAIAFALALLGLWLGRERLAAPWVRRLMIGALVIYGATFPLIFSARAAAWAHRSWPFIMVLLCPLLAAGCVELAHRLRTGTLPHLAKVRLTSTWTTAVLTAVLSVWLVGNTATGASDYMRFPGPHQIGVEGRSVDENTLAAADWLKQNAGPGARIVSDASTSVDMVAFAGAWKVRGFGAWELVTDPSSVQARHLARAVARDVEYLVVDTRMGDLVPDRGFMYEEYEPNAHTGTALTTPLALAELDYQPWAHIVFTSGPIVIYTLDAEASGMTAADLLVAKSEVAPQHAASDKEGWDLFGNGPDNEPGTTATP